MKSLKKLIFRTVLAVFAIGFIAPAAHAQDDDPFKEILFMIIDGDYEKAVSKAERYQDKDDTRRDPRPYIYASMAYYEISKNEEMQEDYPRAFREAIKNAYKARRYDDENQYMPEHSRYINELKAEIMREARFYFDDESWRKAISYAKYVNRIDPDDLSALLLKGIAETRSRNAYQAEKTFEEADTALVHFTIDDVAHDAKDAYRYAVLEYAELMEEEGTKERARPYLDAVAALFEEDPEFAQVYESY